MDIMIMRKRDSSNKFFYEDVVSFKKILIDDNDHWRITLRPDNEYDYKSATFNCREWMLLRSEDPKFLPYGASLSEENATYCGADNCMGCDGNECRPC